MKVVSYGLLLGIFVNVGNAAAGVIKIEDWNGGLEPPSCEEQGYSSTNGAGCRRVGNCWDCSNVSNCDYVWTTSNCATPKELTGDSCTRGGVEYYQSCGCPSSYHVCTENMVGSGDTCVEEDDTTKYSICLCDLNIFQYDETNCSMLAGVSCTDINGEHWNGCTSYNCEGYIYSCNEYPGQHGNGQPCNGLYDSCRCDSQYDEDEASCQSPRQPSGALCIERNPLKRKRTDCTCPGEYNRSCLNTCRNRSGSGYLLQNQCGRFGKCPESNGNYAHCGYDIEECSAGKTLYRLNDNRNFMFNSMSVPVRWDKLYMAEDSAASNTDDLIGNEYPAFVCSASTGATISVYCKEGVCIEEAVESGGTVPQSDYTYEKAGVMLNNTIAVAMIKDPSSSSLLATYVSPWLGKASVPENNNGAYINAVNFDNASNLLMQYNTNWLCYAPENCNDITSTLHSLSSGVTATDFDNTKTTVSDAVGPRNTYNYTFGVPYYNPSSGSRITNSGVINSPYLGILSNGYTALDGKGIVAPAWYCMMHNLGTSDFVMSNNNASTSGGYVGRSFAEGQKVYYYLPTAGDWATFNSYVSNHTGFIQNTLQFSDNYPAVSMWSSSLATDTNTPVAYMDELWYGPSRRIRSVNVELNGENVGSSTIIPHGTMCFIYVPGYQPSNGCDVEISVNNNSNTVTLTGNGCAAQSN